jgi:hypothetical protein
MSSKAANFATVLLGRRAMLRPTPAPAAHLCVAVSAQVVLEPPMSMPSSSSSSSDPQQQQQQHQGPVPYSVNPKLSITRVGSRAYYKALEQLAPQIKLDLAQAEDARKFATNKEDPILKK